MKKLRNEIEDWFEKLEKSWRELPLKNQQKLTLYFLAGYLLLSVGVIFKIWYEIEKSHNDNGIAHIENPLIKK